MNRHVLQIVVAIILSLIISGCASVYRSPSSESLKPSEMAVIEDKDPVHSGIVIVYVDGKWRGFGIIESYELPPGEHSITVALNKHFYKSSLEGGTITRWFQARAGRVYIIGVDIDMVAMKWGIAIVDKELGQRVDYGKSLGNKISP
jgi:hypothetical protein